MTTTRRLAAILAADVVGYSRLVGANEQGALTELARLRAEVIEPNIGKHDGRLFKVMGDGFLAEFASAVQAVTCAVAIQSEAEARASTLPEAQRMRLRVGVHVGDVVVEGEDLLGDGVNIASRLEGIAEPGGISISRTVHDQVRDRMEVGFVDKGEVALKNIARPVQVYAVAAGARALESTATTKPLPLPDKPSIAVLPFQNMSGDPEQEYFADGIVEDIITALSRFNSLFVIARNSSFIYKGRAVDVKQVGRELGVRYVLEGSVRKAIESVRITGQLIDCESSTHLWADRFEGTLGNIFALQDEVTERVVGAISPKVEQAEIERAKRKLTTNLDAYDHYLKAMSNLYIWSRDATDHALLHLYKAIELDPDFASAYGAAARCQAWRRANGWMANLPTDIEETDRLARRAVELGKNDAVVLAGAGYALAYVVREVEAGAAFIDRALLINGNLATAWHFSSFANLLLGRPELALDHEMRAMRLSPLDPLVGQMEAAAALANFCAGHFDAAASWAAMSAKDLPDWLLGLAISAASHMRAGSVAEGQKSIQRLRRLYPQFSISLAKDLFPFRRSEDLSNWIGGLRLAGLPE